MDICIHINICRTTFIYTLILKCTYINERFLRYGNRNIFIVANFAWIKRKRQITISLLLYGNNSQTHTHTKLPHVVPLQTFHCSSNYIPVATVSPDRHSKSRICLCMSPLVSGIYTYVHAILDNSDKFDKKRKERNFE